MKKERILFCNIAYMKNYRGITEDDIPMNGGSYIETESDAGEKYNFLPGTDGYLRGFAEPGFTKGGFKEGKQKQIRIERIDDSAKGKDYLNNVTVIMCAYSPELQKTVIVGYYERATIYRSVIKEQFRGAERWICFKCQNEDGHIINDSHRIFTVPRAAKDGNGFGESNFWYADNDKGIEFAREVLDYLEGLSEE